MLPVSALSNTANVLRDLFLQEIDDLDAVAQIKIGNPEDTFADLKNTEKNGLNLFFYSVKYDGYPADGLSSNPFYVRLFCLITAVGFQSQNSEGGTISKGENDLRLIGEVMNVLHKHPLISISDSNSGEIVADLEVVPHNLDLDGLNHIWSTQGDTSYRLSVAYEMALAPIPLSRAIERSPRVGSFALAVHGEAKQEPLPSVGFGLESSTPDVPVVTIDTGKTDWSPHLCFVGTDEENRKICLYSYLFQLGSDALTDFQPALWIATDPNARIDLVWERWSNDSGWKPDSRQDDILAVTMTVLYGTPLIYVGTKNRGLFKSMNEGVDWEQKITGLDNLHVQAIAVDLSNTNTLYLGTAGGGVFKSINAGDSWVEANNKLDNLHINALIIDPSNSDKVYATTEGGVFRTKNAGGKWKDLNKGLGSLQVNVLLIDPADDNTLYAGTAAGVFKSTDGGDRWDQANQGLNALFIATLAVEPGNSSIVYAGTKVGLYKSIDGGDHWKAIRSGISDLAVQTLAMDSENKNILFAGTESGGVFKSINGGEDWAQLTTGLEERNIQHLSIDPSNHNIIFAGASGGHLFKSNDGAANWIELSAVPLGLNEDPLIIDPNIVSDAELLQDSLPDKSSTGQYMLYLERVYQHGGVGPEVRAKSNPLLVTIYAGSA